MAEERLESRLVSFRYVKRVYELARGIDIERERKRKRWRERRRRR